MSKSFFETKASENIIAHVLLYNGEIAGKVLSHHNKGTCVTSVFIYKGDLADIDNIRFDSTSRGFGFNRENANLSNYAFKKGIADFFKSSGINGFEKFGYQIERVI